MKFRIFTIWLAATVFAACTSNEMDIPSPVDDSSDEFFASIEGTFTKVSVDDRLNVVWNADDRASIFDKTDVNQEYRFTGKDGDDSGIFKIVSDGSSSTGNPLSFVYSVYPYKETTTVGSDGTITLTLPEEQAYRENDFGSGANTMVSVSSDKELLFKNLCGYLVLKLYGDDVSVRSISLKGNNGEILAGAANVTAAADKAPTFVFSGPGSISLALNCPSPVSIGSTAESATVFWLVVPPTTFSLGFTISVTDSKGNVFEKSTSSEAAIPRNTVFRMKALKVIPERVFQVTDSYVQAYLDEVNYSDMDFSVSHIKEYPGGGPGEADIPPTVTLEWDKSSSDGKITVRLWDEEWSREYELPKGSSKLDVTNLVPDSKYSYEVIESSGDVISQGSFSTTGSLHQVYFESDVRNARDLGGWKTTDGKTVRFRKLYRGGQMDYSDYLSSDGRKEMLAEGIKAELDLRESKYVSKESSLGSGYSFYGPGFDRGYVDGMLEGNPEKVRKCFEFVVDCLRNEEPVFFHCASGRDRTGTLAILLLGVLGVREGDIAKDYELTYFSPDEWSMSGKQGSRYYDHTRDVSTYRATVEFLSGFDSSSFKAGVEKYLLNIGVKQGDIDYLRSVMLK